MRRRVTSLSDPTPHVSRVGGPGDFGPAWTRPSSAANCQAEFSRGRGKVMVKGRDGSFGGLGRQQHAAIGQAEPTPRPQGGQAFRCGFNEAHCDDLEPVNGCLGFVELVGAGRPDEDFSESQRTDAQRLVRRIEEQSRGAFVMSVRRFEMGDQDAGVENDHAGQSSRSRSRIPRFVGSRERPARLVDRVQPLPLTLRRLIAQELMALLDEMKQQLGAAVTIFRPTARGVVERPSYLVGLGNEVSWSGRRHQADGK